MRQIAACGASAHPLAELLSLRDAYKGRKRPVLRVAGVPIQSLKIDGVAIELETADQMSSTSSHTRPQQ